jgi:hypothetical protein
MQGKIQKMNRLAEGLRYFVADEMGGVKSQVQRLIFGRSVSLIKVDFVRNQEL